MSAHFQSAMVSSSFVYPNAVVWSDENLLAVACSKNVLILNPAKPSRSRGVITVPSTEPFPVGAIDGTGADLQSGCLLPFELSRDNRQCVRSISWSPVGLADNAGCLLAVCTTGGHVKLYGFPFCELTAEWIEVMDISEMLYTYLKDTNFGESQTISSGVIPYHDKSDHEYANDAPISSTLKKCKRKQKTVVSTMHSDDSFNLELSLTMILFCKITKEVHVDPRESETWQMVPVSEPKVKSPKKAGKKKAGGECNILLVSPQQYASRRAMLAPLSVAWSPILGNSGDGIVIPHNSSNCCSILAVGGKCGGISFWRVYAPERYSIDTRNTGKVQLIGFLKAHDSWITTISWTLYGSDPSTPQFLLAAGSSDGRVKIWQANGEELLNLSDVSHSFTLLEEVTTADSATVSTLSLYVPSQSPCKVLLAIGKGSGSIELHIIDLHAGCFENGGCYDAHDHIVTGLSWAFGGRCLYSCSQDNTMKSWILVSNSLFEVPIPSNTPSLNSSFNVSHVSDSCFGLAVSPGNLAVALAHKFDANLLNPMYEARAHKGAIEFLWIGGQQLDISPTISSDSCVEAFPEFSKKELGWWEINIMWSLNQLENLTTILNIWDIVVALTAFKQDMTGFVEHILLEWLKSYFGSHFGISITFMSEASKMMPKLSSRQLHLINIIIRHVLLKESEAYGLDLSSTKEEHVKFWKELLLASENELRERLVGFGLTEFLSVLSNSSFDGREIGDGLVQMEHWVSLNAKNIKDNLKFLAAEVGRTKRKFQEITGDEVDEQCNFCSAIVPFKSTENAICSERKCSELKRCAITMRVCPTRFSWFCICCQRMASKLAPRILFTLLEYPPEFTSFTKSSACKESLIPCCPFCGILLGKSLPEHLLSPSPV